MYSLIEGLSLGLASSGRVRGDDGLAVDERFPGRCVDTFRDGPNANVVTVTKIKGDLLTLIDDYPLAFLVDPVEGNDLLVVVLVGSLPGLTQTWVRGFW